MSDCGTVLKIVPPAPPKKNKTNEVLTDVLGT